MAAEHALGSGSDPRLGRDLIWNLVPVALLAVVGLGMKLLIGRPDWWGKAGLGVFNLIPVPPLDGAGGVAVLLPEDWARRLQLLMAQPLVAFAGVLVAWFTIPFLFGPIYVLALALVLPELL